MLGDTLAEGNRIDVVHSILADRERRAVVRDLAANGPSATISGLAQRIADPGDDRELHVRLHHHHLPKMAEAGVVEYDPDGGRVSLIPAGRRVEAVRKRTVELLDGE